MRPPDKLIEAWQQFLHTQREAQIARMKSIGMFKCSAPTSNARTCDTELYNRANELHMRAAKLDQHADVEFRKALKAEYANRFRIEWTNPTTCTVWVRERYAENETAVHFTKSLKCRKSLH